MDSYTFNITETKKKTRGAVEQDVVMNALWNFMSCCYSYKTFGARMKKY